MTSIEMGSTMLVPLFANLIMDRFGIINTMCVSIACVCIRMCGYSFTYTSPPYPLFAYAALEFTVQLYFVTTIAYCSKIAPHYLTATAISMSSVMSWIVGMGVGSLISGLLVDLLNMREMFITMGIACSAFFLFYLVLYHLLIKSFEVDQNKKNEEEKTTATKSQTEEKLNENATARIVITRL